MVCQVMGSEARKHFCEVYSSKRQAVLIFAEAVATRAFGFLWYPCVFSLPQIQPASGCSLSWNSLLYWSPSDVFFRRVDAIYIFLKLLIFTTSNLIFLIQTFISLIFVPKGHIKRQVVHEYQEPTQSIDLKTLLGLLVN